jgi:hypothetical protein
MKIRFDYVTNSSSASYVISCKEILNKEELKKYLQEEYGKQGLKVMDEYIFTGKEIKEGFYENDYLSVSKKDIEELDNEKEYLYVNEDIEGGNALASITIELRNTNILNGIFYDSWSGFDG